MRAMNGQMPGPRGRLRGAGPAWRIWGLLAAAAAITLLVA